MARRKDIQLARYQDHRGRSHRVVLRDRLALDLCRGEPTRVVCELSAEEGAEQARATLFGSAIDEGYLVRAAREEEPFCRKLVPEDLRRRPRPEAEGDQGSARADEEPPLAA